MSCQDSVARSLPIRFVIFLAVAGFLLASGAARAQAPSPAPELEGEGIPPTPSNFFIINDNTISYHYEFTGTNPGSGVTGKNVMTFNHFDVWSYGTNLVNIDWLRATNPNTTPAAPCGFPNANTGCPGYTEWYGFARSTLGWNQLFDTKAFSFGPLTNISFLAGFDLNTDNTNLASRKRSIEGGVQFSFAAPYDGLVNVGVVAYKEWQHDGIAAQLGSNPGGHVDFNPTWAVEFLYDQPLGFLPPTIPLSYNALVTVHGPKGAGEPGAPNRVTEYYTQQALLLDVGQIVAQRPKFVYLWGAYRWWTNKFGLNPSTTGLCCTTESTWMLGWTVRF